MNGGRRRGGPGTARRAAVAIPLFLFSLFAFVGLAGFVGTVAAYNYFARDLEDPRRLEEISFAEESIIYDRTGRIELARFGSTRREVVAFDQIPPVVLDATTAIEDKTFWTNTGFDPAGIASAALDALRGDARGASTITQQLVRQRLLDPELVQDPERRYERKIKEIIQSIRLTQAFPGEEGKQRVITAYLNQNFYGSNYYGVLAAAKGYFGVESLDELTLAQAAILAGIPQSPSRYDLNRNAVQQEDGTLVVPEDAQIVERRNHILDLMAQDRTPRSGNMFTAADFEDAKEEPVVLNAQTATRWRAPHFVWAVRKELAVKLCGAEATTPDPEVAAEGGDNEIATCPELEQGGLRVITTLDWEMQQLADRWVKAAAILPRIRSSTPEEYAERIGVEYEDWMQALTDKNVNNGALAAMDYETGEILAYVGSAEYYAATSAKPAFQPQYDVLADGWRQPGSAFKPFNYTTGFNDRTLTPATMFMDVATDFGNDYHPTNADNLERGPLRVRQALHFSLNIPSVKALQRNGINHVFDVARRAGMQFQTENPERDAGLSMALGTLEVHPIDLLTAFATLANDGTRLSRTSILRVTDKAGEDVIRPYEPTVVEEVFDEQSAYLMTDILAGNTDPDVNPYWGNFQIVDGQGNARPAALKTGTNNDAKDLNAYGYLAPPTPEGRERGEYALVIGAWNGNSDNTEVSTPGNPVFSVDVTARVWERFIEEATADWQINAFTDQRPAGLVEVEVDAFSGMLPGPFSAHTVTELFIEGFEPRDEDNTKVALQIQRETGLLWQDGCGGHRDTRGFLSLDHVESEFPVWNEWVREWIARAKRGPGVEGGPDNTRTSYFIDLRNQPFGPTWGAPWPPTETCTIRPTPSPTPPPTPSPSPSPSPSPTPEPTPSPEPTPVLPTPPQATPTEDIEEGDDQEQEEDGEAVSEGPPP